VFTRIDWLEEFGAALAAADTAHFDARSSIPLSPRDPAFGPPSGPGSRRTRSRNVVPDARNRDVDDQLDAEGL
jgi:hypothetical protein